MSRSDYEQYHKNGGTYIIPVEVFNELFDELDKIKEKLNREYYIGYVEHNDKVIDEILEMLGGTYVEQ